MNDKPQVLVVVEPENHPSIVVERGAWLARQNGLGLALLWCDTEIGPLGGAFLVSNEARDIAEQIRAAQQQMVEEIAETVSGKGLHVATKVLEERPIADAILEQVADLNPAYLVKGTHYHDAAERAIFVDTDWQLMRSCSCPLWLVKAKKMSAQPTIVASVDPFHSHDKSATLDRKIVEQAKLIAEKGNGDVHLFHAYQPLSAIGAAANRTFKPIKLPKEEITSEMRKVHQQKLDELADNFGIDSKHRHQQTGSPRELLPTFARTIDADLVVMGAQARWGLKRAIIGSTAERVLDHLPCDILLVSNDA